MRSQEEIQDFIKDVMTLLSSQESIDSWMTNLGTRGVNNIKDLALDRSLEKADADIAKREVERQNIRDEINARSRR